MSMRHRPKRVRKTKQEKQEILKSGPFNRIVDRLTLIKFLKNEPNSYNNKVLTLIERQNLPKAEWTGSAYDEIHHIIPTSEGGPDENWNLLPVSYKEHKELHQLRYESYGKEGDRVAAMGREEIREYTKKQKTEASKRGHETMKREQIGWWNPEVQAELGRKGAKAGKTPARETAYEAQAKNSNKYVSLFDKPLNFVFQDEQHSFSVQSSAGQFKRTGQIKDFLLEHTPKDSVFYEKIQLDRYFTTNFNKVLRRLLPNPEGKDVRSSYKGWTIIDAPI